MQNEEKEFTREQVIEIIERVKQHAADNAVLVHENNGYEDIMNWFNTNDGKLKVYKNSILSINSEDFLKEVK